MMSPMAPNKRSQLVVRETAALLLVVLLLFVAPSSGNLIIGAASSSFSGSSSSLQDLASTYINDEDVATLLDNNHNIQDEARQVDIRQLFAQQTEGAFGDRCGNHNFCGDGLECTQVSLGNRCLPNSCLQDQMSHTFQETFNIDHYKATLYDSAGYSEEEILAALGQARNEREFLESKEFLSLRQALHDNLEPLNDMLELRNSCATGENATTVNGTVSYFGLHIEAGVFVDVTVDYLVTSNGDDQRTVVRLCLGAELGAGAEISYIFGFTDTNVTENMLCGSVFADVDIVLLVAAGAAVGIGFNGVFFYEFTFGGGLGLGLGGGICAGTQYGTVNGTNVTLPPRP